MRKFLSYMLVLAAVVIAAAALCDLAVSRGLSRAESTPHGTLNAIMRGNLENDLLVLGNSRAQCSFDPRVIDSLLGTDSRNLGISGQPIGTSIFQYSLYRQQCATPPRIIMVNIDFMELNVCSPGVERQQYYPYILDRRFSDMLRLNNFTFTDRYVPLARYFGQFKTVATGLAALFGLQLHTRWDRNRCKGYSNVDEPFDSSAFEAVISGDERIDCANDAEAARMLEEFCKEAAADSAKVFFVYAPVYHEVLDHIDQEATMETFRRIAEDNGIQLLDYSQDEIGLDSTFFYNACHLNHEGAGMFSRKLAERIAGLIKGGESF